MQNRKPITEVELQAARNLKRIFNERKSARELNQTSLAKKVGIGQSAVSMFLNGTMQMNFEMVAKFAKALDCKPTDIRADFLDALAIVPDERAKTVITVKRSLSGAAMEPKTVETSLRSTCVSDSSVFVDISDYEPVIRKNSTLLIDKTVDPVEGDMVYIELTSAVAVLGVLKGFNYDAKQAVYENLVTHDIVETSLDEIKSIDWISGIEAPAIIRQKRTHQSLKIA